MASKAELLAKIDALGAQLTKVQQEYQAVLAELAALKAQHGFVLRAITGSIVPTGDQGNLVVNPPPSSVSWRPIPSPLATIDRSKAFPQYIPDIKKRFLIDPNHLVTFVEIV